MRLCIGRSNWLQVNSREQQVVNLVGKIMKSSWKCLTGIYGCWFAASLLGSNSMDTTTMAAIGTTDHTSKLQNHHQITVTTGSIGTANESRFTIRRNSFRRSSSSWILDPKRILFIFATLSSMGTILLIYFTLSISKSSTAGGDFDLPQ